jgi:FkbM family methyltransferase
LSLARTPFLAVWHRNKIVKIDNFLLATDKKDRGISRELLVYKKREHESFKYIEQLKENELVIDIGANIGYYAIPSAKKAHRGKVFAIEPVKSNFQKLVENFELNYLVNYSAHRLAIGEKNEEKKINIYEKKNWSSFNSNLPAKIIRHEKVKVQTLDSFIAENLLQPPTFIRMDVEGYELPILLGAEKLLKSDEKMKIMIEIHPHYLEDRGIKKILSLLEKNNFRISQINLEISPALWRYRKLYNRYRKIFQLLPYGVVNKKYYNFESLSKILRTKNQYGEYLYYPHVIFEKQHSIKN